jgi:hypothetical protein
MVNGKMTNTTAKEFTLLKMDQSNSVINNVLMNRFEGSWKNGTREGNGAYFYENGDWLVK